MTKAMNSIKDVDAQHMELLLNFMYRGEINVKVDDLMDLIATAKGLSIHGLSDSKEVKKNSESACFSNDVPNDQTSKAMKRGISPSKPRLFLNTIEGIYLLLYHASWTPSLNGKQVDFARKKTCYI